MQAWKFRLNATQRLFDPAVTDIPSLVELDPSKVLSAPQAMPVRLYGLIKHRVLTGQLKPGVRIIETELSAEFSVSRTPLREALNRLAHEGLLVLHPYKGYSVTPLSIAHFRELCELRRILEPEAAALAAERAKPSDLEALRAHAVLAYTPKNPNSYVDYLRANGAFHLALVRSTGNRMLEGMVMSALDRHQRPCYLGLDVGIDSVTSTKEHFEIIAAIERRDTATARTLMAAHIGNAEERISNSLRAAGYE